MTKAVLRLGSRQAEMVWKRKREILSELIRQFHDGGGVFKGKMRKRKKETENIG